MSKKVIISDDLKTAFVPEVGALISTGISSLSKSDKAQIKEPLNEDGLHKIDWQPWGNNDLYPNEIKKERDDNSDLNSGLANVAMSIIADGLVYGKIKNDGGKRTAQVLNGTVPEIDKFFRDSNIDEYFANAVFHFITYWNGFADSFLNQDKTKVQNIRMFSPGEYRLGLQDNYGLINDCVFNPNFMNGNMFKEKSIPLPLLDNIGDKRENISALKSRRFVTHFKGFGDEKFYTKAPWHSLITNNVLAFSKLIWKYKNSTLNKSINMFFHIEIADFYWTGLYGKDFYEKSLEEKKTIMENELSAFNTKLKGAENGGMSLMTFMQSDPDGKNLLSSWKVNTIEQGKNQNLFIEDEREVTSKIYRAIFMDTALAGAPMGKGGGLGNGSGSDKKNADTRQQRVLQYVVNQVCAPLYNARDFNGWDSDIVFWADTEIIQDLSNITPAQRNNPQPA